MKIAKRNGRVVLFDDEKLKGSILRASLEAPEEELSEKGAEALAGEVFARVTRERDIVSTADIRACTAQLLREKGYPQTAERYLDFKKA